MRGDEPLDVYGDAIAYVAINLFPACAGMNRDSITALGNQTTVPRMRGDEPLGNA